MSHRQHSRAQAVTAPNQNPFQRSTDPRVTTEPVSPRKPSRAVTAPNKNRYLTCTFQKKLTSPATYLRISKTDAQLVKKQIRGVNADQIKSKLRFLGPRTGGSEFLPIWLNLAQWRRKRCSFLTICVQSVSHVYRCFANYNYLVLYIQNTMISILQ